MMKFKWRGMERKGWDWTGRDGNGGERNGFFCGMMKFKWKGSDWSGLEQSGGEGNGSDGTGLERKGSEWAFYAA
jgi:hypothetical protein